jgi:hypothetical protein
VAVFLAGAFLALVLDAAALGADFFAGVFEGVLSVLRLVFLAAGLLVLATGLVDLAVFLAGALEDLVEAFTASVLGTAGLVAPNLERTGFSPQISSKL